MSVSNFEELAAHRGHEIVVVVYNGQRELLGEPGAYLGTKPKNHQSYWSKLNYPVNAAIECLTCSEVLLDYDRE